MMKKCHTGNYICRKKKIVISGGKYEADQRNEVSQVFKEKMKVKLDKFV